MVTASFSITQEVKKLYEVYYKKNDSNEQKITRLISEGKMDPNAHYIFDQNGSLFMVTWDD